MGEGSVLASTTGATPGAGPAPAPPVPPALPTILSADRNRVEAAHDATAHAELLVLRAAAAAAPPGGWRLAGTTLYVTLEPCAMCAGAALLARVDRVVYGAPNPSAGADGGWVGLLAAAKGEGQGVNGLHRASAAGEAGEGGGGVSGGAAHGSHPGLEVRTAEMESERGRTGHARRARPPPPPHSQPMPLSLPSLPLQVTRGVRAEEAAALLRGFFRARRAGADPASVVGLGGAPGGGEA